MLAVHGKSTTNTAYFLALERERDRESARKEEDVNWMDFCSRKANPSPTLNKYKDSSAIPCPCSQPLLFVIC